MGKKLVKYSVYFPYATHPVSNRDRLIENEFMVTKGEGLVGSNS